MDLLSDKFTLYEVQFIEARDQARPFQDKAVDAPVFGAIGASKTYRIYQEKRSGFVSSR